MSKLAIWKYTVPIEDTIVIEMPDGAKIIHVGLDPHGDLCAWCEVRPGAPKVLRNLSVRGTGYTFYDDGDPVHVGSVVQGPCVWHLYDFGEA